MPLKINKVGTKYRVKNTSNGNVLAKGTTLNKAKKQVRLLGMMSNKGTAGRMAASASQNTIFKGRPRFGSGIE